MDMRPVCHNPFDHPDEFRAADRFWHDNIGMAARCWLSQSLGFGGETDDARIPVAGIACPEVPDNAVTVDVGHVLIEDHQIKGLLERCLQRLPSVTCHGQVNVRKTSKQ